MDRHGNEMTLEAWDGFRLSRQQERTLSLARAGHQVVRTLPRTPRRDVRPRAARECRHDVVAAHESLRTSYRQVLGERSAVFMVIDEPTDVVIVEISAASDAEIVDFCQAESLRDANVPSPTRLALFAQVDGGYTLVLSAARMSSTDHRPTSSSAICSRPMPPGSPVAPGTIRTPSSTPISRSGSSNRRRARMSAVRRPHYARRNWPRSCRCHCRWK